MQNAPAPLSSWQENGLLNPWSLLGSVVIALVPPILYLLGTQQVQRSAALAFEALFFLTLALVFYFANLGAKRIALLAGLQWLCQSWATFGRVYRTWFWGTLCLSAFLATVFELTTGQRLTDYISSVIR